MNSTKLMYISVLALGKKPCLYDIYEISGIIEIGGQVVEHFSIGIQPFAILEKPNDFNSVDWAKFQGSEDKYFEFTAENYTRLKKLATPIIALHEFQQLIEKYIDKYDKDDKFILAGHLAARNISFLQTWFERCKDPFFGSWFQPGVLDILSLVAQYEILTSDKVPSYRLARLEKYFKTQDLLSSVPKDWASLYQIRALIQKLLNIAIVK